MKRVTIVDVNEATGFGGSNFIIIMCYYCVSPSWIMGVQC